MLFTISAFFSYLKSNDIKIHPFSSLIETNLNSNIIIDSNVKDLPGCANSKSICKINTDVIWERTSFPNCIVQYSHEFNFARANAIPSYKSLISYPKFECIYVEEVSFPISIKRINELNTRSESESEVITIKMIKRLVMRQTFTYDHDSLLLFIRTYELSSFLEELTKDNVVFTSYVLDAKLVVGEEVLIRGKKHIRYSTMLIKEENVKIVVYLFDVIEWQMSRVILNCNRSNSFISCLNQIHRIEYDFQQIK
eukprot:NODE_635_length_5742_cov_0.308701.p3 type:complete len:253 gc:universal NODE_635_length_5742_cov_0.308701:4648-5406(+)